MLNCRSTGTDAFEEPAFWTVSSPLEPPAVLTRRCSERRPVTLLRVFQSVPVEAPPPAAAAVPRVEVHAPASAAAAVPSLSAWMPASSSSSSAILPIKVISSADMPPSASFATRAAALNDRRFGLDGGAAEGGGAAVGGGAAGGGPWEMVRVQRLRRTIS